MALPRLDVPTFEIVLPISQKKIKFRPFLVKEQKILLMALESNESETIQSNIEQIINNCVLEPIEIRNLPIVDVEFLFLNLRAKSVGEVVETQYRCENEVNGELCNNLMDVSFNVLDVQINKPEVNDIIQLTSSVGIKMKYPTYEIVDRIKGIESVADIGFEYVLSCIEYIFDGDSMYYAHETPHNELIEFVESLTQDQFEKIEQFIEKVPSIEKKIETTCKKCGFQHTIVARELQDFFV